ncbi:Zinc finger protein 714 [Plecturocebus cupreus]
MAHACNPSTLGGQGRQITNSRDQDHPGQHGETPSLLKIQKLAGHGGAHLQSQLLGRLRQENCLNLEGRDCIKTLGGDATSHRELRGASGRWPIGTAGSVVGAPTHFADLALRTDKSGGEKNPELPKASSRERGNFGVGLRKT